MDVIRDKAKPTSFPLTTICGACSMPSLLLTIYQGPVPKKVHNSSSRHKLFYNSDYRAMANAWWHHYVAAGTVLSHHIPGAMLCHGLCPIPMAMPIACSFRYHGHGLHALGYLSCCAFGMHATKTMSQQLPCLALPCRAVPYHTDDCIC
jgi:hypothetical protein